MVVRVALCFAAFMLVLLVEYALNDTGVARRLVALTSAGPAPPVVAVEEPAEVKPVRQSAPVAPPSKPARAVTPVVVVAAAVALPIGTSFEDDEAGWNYNAKGGDGLGARSTDVAHEGGFSLLSQAGESANRGWPGWERSGRIAVAPGRSYLLRAWALSPDGGNAWLDLQLFDKADTWHGGRSSGCSKGRPRTGTWELIELRYVNDDPVITSVRLGLLQCLNHSKGHPTTIYFDDVTFAAED